MPGRIGRAERNRFRDHRPDHRHVQDIGDQLHEQVIGGHPTVIVKNMPGAGSTRAGIYIGTVASKDGGALGAMMPLAEAQSEWVADLLAGESALPTHDEMWKEIKDRREALRRRYVKSTRHTIQVDFFPYLREIDKERKAGRKRKARGRGIVPAQDVPADLSPAA